MLHFSRCRAIEALAQLSISRSASNQERQVVVGQVAVDEADLLERDAPVGGAGEAVLTARGEKAGGAEADLEVAAWAELDQQEVTEHLDGVVGMVRKDLDVAEIVLGARGRVLGVGPRVEQA